VSGKPTYKELEQRIKELEKEAAERKRVEGELKTAEENLRHILETAPIGVGISQVENGEIVFSNTRNAEMRGRHDNEIDGSSAKDYWVDPDQRKEFLQIFQHQGYVPSTEVRLKRPDGSTYWSLIAWNSIWHGGEKRILFWVYDISAIKQTEEALRQARDELELRVAERTNELQQEVDERKQAEAALKESEERYRRTLAAAPDSIAITRLADGEFLLINEYFCQLFGYSHEETIGKTPFDLELFVNPADRKKFVRILKETGEVKGFEIQYRTKDATIIDTLFSARLLSYRGQDCLVSVTTDISAQKQAEAALRESEEKYRFLVENAHDAIFIIQDEVMKFPNPKASEMLGYSADELTMISFTNLMHAEDRQMILEKHNRWMLGEELPSSSTFRILNKDGDQLWTQLNTVFITWEGRPATLNFLRDITQHKKLEDQLLNAKKMEAIGTLAGGIAHDFNNLLMGIQGNASLMLTEFDSGHPHYESLSNIEQYVRSGADLTKQLLGFARGGKYEVKITDLNELIEENSRMFSRTKKDIEIHTKYEENIWSVEVDKGQIGQVLLNLFVNAWQAMPGGGELYLETQNITLAEDQAKAHGLKSGKFVKISVTDTGLGMDETTQHRIFDPFFSTKEKSRGVGLGLASVYGIIKNHGGIITVHSEKGDGTTFYIHLPASEKEVKEKKKELINEDKEDLRP